MDFNSINSSKEVVRVACKKCGYSGHLTFQCRNFLKVSKSLSHPEPECLIWKKKLGNRQRTTILWLTTTILYEILCRWIRTKKFCWTFRQPAVIRIHNIWHHWRNFGKRSWWTKNANWRQNWRSQRKRNRRTKNRNGKRKARNRKRKKCK